MAIILSNSVQAKLNDKHGGVTINEIRQCFANFEGEPKIDSRAKHLTNPVTRWFIAETDCGRLLKICFMPYPNGDYVIKTAFEPDADDIAAFN